MKLCIEMHSHLKMLPNERPHLEGAPAFEDASIVVLAVYLPCPQAHQS